VSRISAAAGPTGWGFGLPGRGMSIGFGCGVPFFECAEMKLRFP